MTKFQVNRKVLMQRAWLAAKWLHRTTGRPVRECLPECMRAAWIDAKQDALRIAEMEARVRNEVAAIKAEAAARAVTRFQPVLPGSFWAQVARI